MPIIKILFLLLNLSPNTNYLQNNNSNWIEPITGMQFILMRHGKFLMGTPEIGLADTLKSYQHEVEISKDFPNRRGRDKK